MEIARATGTPDLDTPLRDLKKAQDALGDLHDRQTFLDEIPPSMPARTETGSEALVTLVKQVVEAEALKQHERYLARCKNLVEIASQMQAIRIGRSWVVPSLATATAGVIALSSGAYVLRRRFGGTRLTPALAPSGFERRALIGT